MPVKLVIVMSQATNNLLIMGFILLDQQMKNDMKDERLL